MKQFTLEHLIADKEPEQLPELNAIDVAIESAQFPVLKPSLVAERPKDFETIALVLEGYEKEVLTEEVLEKLSQDISKVDPDFEGTFTQDELKTYHGEVQLGLIDSIKKTAENIVRDWKFWNAKSNEGWAAARSVLERLKDMADYEQKEGKVKLPQSFAEGLVTMDGKLVDVIELLNAVENCLKNFQGSQKKLFEIAKKTEDAKLLDALAGELGLTKVYEKNDRGIDFVAFGIYSNSYLRTVFERPLKMVARNSYHKDSAKIDGMEAPTLDLKTIENLIRKTDKITDVMAKAVKAEQKQMKENIKELDQMAKSDLATVRQISMRMGAATNMGNILAEGIWDTSWGLFNYSLVSFRDYARK